jgi:CheY-like chemotaxis protein
LRSFWWTSNTSGRKKGSFVHLSAVARTAARCAKVSGLASGFRAKGVWARRRKTALCIDDNQSGLNTCKVILEDFGYTVLTISNSREGLEVFASNATVILDCGMPEMNGELVAAEMRKKNPRAHSHAFRLRVTATEGASISGQICRQGRSGRVLALGSSATVESSRKAKARKNRYPF